MTDCPYEEPPDDGTPRQGALYRDICIASGASPVEKRDDEIDVIKSDWPYAVVLSQDCDLIQDHNNRENFNAEAAGAQHDKIMPGVLICPAYQAASFKEGTHIPDQEMQRQSRKLYDSIQQNKAGRYHYLAAWSLLQVPELVVDFKHYFAIPTEMLREKFRDRKYYVVRLACPYREHLSHRFASYLGRVGLPVDHHRVTPAPQQ